MFKERKPKRIKCTAIPGRTALGGTAYIHRCGEQWVCMLDNGISASFFYAVGNCDEAALRFSLEDASSDKKRLAIVQAVAGQNRVCELV